MSPPKIIITGRKEPNKVSDDINGKFIRRISSHLPNCHYVPIFSRKGGILVSPKKLCENYKPDILIHTTHHLLDEEYFKYITCKKIMIGVDIYKIVQKNKLNLYSHNNFDLLLHRHYLPPSLISRIPVLCRWFPWAVDTNTFFPISDYSKKIKKLGFVGTSKSRVYEQRREIISELKSKKLLDDYGVVLGKRYPKLLRSYLGLVTSSELGSPYAKVFEIMSSGSVVLSAPFGGGKELFGKQNPVVFFKNDLSDLVDKASYILKNDCNNEKLSKRGREIILKHHSIPARLLEFKDHILNILNDAPTRKFWKCK